jgi:predicted metal-dependent hydrolase
MRPGAGKERRLVDFETGPAWVSVRKSSRARRIRVRVTEDGAEIVLPVVEPYEVGWQVFDRHIGWVSAKLKASQPRQGHVWVAGRLVWTEFEPSRAVKVACESNRVRIQGPEFKTVFEDWLKSRARSFAHEETPVLARVMGVSHTSIQIRGQRTRWGSCSARGTVTFNWRLAMAPEDTFRYVIVHELAHLMEMNHSPAFWQIVDRHCPEWRCHRRWLRTHGRQLWIPRSPACSLPGEAP